MSENLSTSHIIEDLNSSISNGIDYLYDHQLPNGEFLMYMSGDDSMESWNLPESCVFTATIIGTCLLHLKNQERVNHILTNAAEFLVYQMDKGGTWNHYTILHRFRKTGPQDIDSTACTSYFLEKMKYDFPKNTNKRLILDNKNSKGLFYTWITFRFRPNKNRLYWYYAAKELKILFKSLIFWYSFKCSRYDIDAGVNANILFYIGKSKETQPVITFLTSVINEKKESNCDKWYANPIVIYYFISRNINAAINDFEEIIPKIIERILFKQHKNGRFGKSELETALAISTLINIKYQGIEIKKGVNHLLNTQSDFGNWKRWAFYYTGGPKGSSLGSEELSTAFCLEALEKFKQTQNITT